MKYIKSTILILLFILVIGVGKNFAQTPTPTPKDDVVLKALEEVTDKLRRTEIERDSFAAQLVLEKERTANLRIMSDNYKEQAEFWKAANNKGNQIDTTSQQIIFQLRSQVSDDIIRIRDLESENKSLRSSRTLRTVLGFAAGIGTGFYISNKK